jgi:hypothetical protein
MLKVPQSVRSPSRTAAEGRARLAAAPPPATVQMPATPAPAGRPVPWWARLVLWVLAVPLGALVAAVLANSIGFFTYNDVENAFLETTWSRFVPLVRLVPLWAVAAALIVHLGVVGIDRWMRARSTVGVAEDPAHPGAPATTRRRPFGRERAS